MILFLMRKERASLKRLCILMQACFFSLWMDLMTQQLGFMLLLSVLLLDVYSISTRGSSSSSCSEREERSQMLCACRERCRRANVRRKTQRALISKDCYINYQQFKQLIAPQNSVNQIREKAEFHYYMNRVNYVQMEYGLFHQIAYYFKPYALAISVYVNHSSQFSEIGEDQEEDESCSAYFSKGSLLKRFKQMLMASQCKFLSLTRDSLIQLRAYDYRKLRKISRSVQLLIIFFIRLLLYFLRYSNVLQVRIAYRISFLSKILTFSDFKKETKALQKFLEIFLVFLSWSYSPSLLSLLLLIFLKMQTFLPSVLSLVSFFSLSLVETASFVSLGNCSA